MVFLESFDSGITNRHIYWEQAQTRVSKRVSALSLLCQQISPKGTELKILSSLSKFGEIPTVKTWAAIFLESYNIFLLIESETELARQLCRRNVPPGCHFNPPLTHATSEYRHSSRLPFPSSLPYSVFPVPSTLFHLLFTVFTVFVRSQNPTPISFKHASNSFNQNYRISDHRKYLCYFLYKKNC